MTIYRVRFKFLKLYVNSCVNQYVLVQIILSPRCSQISLLCLITEDCLTFLPDLSNKN